MPKSDKVSSSRRTASYSLYASTDKASVKKKYKDVGHLHQISTRKAIREISKEAISMAKQHLVKDITPSNRQQRKVRDAEVSTIPLPTPSYSHTEATSLYDQMIQTVGAKPTPTSSHLAFPYVTPHFSTSPTEIGEVANPPTNTLKYLWFIPIGGLLGAFIAYMIYKGYQEVKRQMSIDEDVDTSPPRAPSIQSLQSEHGTFDASSELDETDETIVPPDTEMHSVNLSDDEDFHSINLTVDIEDLTTYRPKTDFVFRSSADGTPPPQ